MGYCHKMAIRICCETDCVRRLCFIYHYKSVVFGAADFEFKSILKFRNSFVKIIISLKNFTSFAFWTRIIHFFFSLTYFFVDCMYMGVAYKSGSSFPKGDGCNRCTCMDTGDISCDQHSCLPCKLRNNFLIYKYVDIERKQNVIVLLYIFLHQLFLLQTTILKIRRMLE